MRTQSGRMCCYGDRTDRMRAVRQVLSEEYTKTITGFGWLPLVCWLPSCVCGSMTNIPLRLTDTAFFTTNDRWRTSFLRITVLSKQWSIYVNTLSIVPQIPNRGLLWKSCFFSVLPGGWGFLPPLDTDIEGEASGGLLRLGTSSLLCKPNLMKINWGTQRL